MNLILRYTVSVMILALWIFASVEWDKRWRAKHPEHKHFRWGYFQAIWAFISGIAWLIYCVFALLRHSIALSAGGLLMVGVYVAVGIVSLWAGYELLKRKTKRSWIVVVVLTLNLITWCIDLEYGWKRWNEFQA
jgi:hypothetical protein